ncbi:nuclear transport factor 2 family protein [Ferruginibacter lapsinanis]|uniref:nuclear transport factor 2 family protein n=1 Tax=Ferruginibacter lapsinanis TaxID=563172 RepID=UPI001E65DD64|nr:nuclear transport factor 2 family protein [Ferruginibacter lapsinanis]UEG49166.1 nuclear transport factor 2 family protein [Ferruginibacter lapsinanis]
MSSNAQVLEKFYTAFSKLDYVTMNSCYSDDIVFFDPVFGLLRGDEVKLMWEMLCKNAKDFSLTFSDITDLDEEYSTCRWVATYTFSATGKRVVNKIKANMRFADGKIVEHSDGFSIHQWSKQALGLSGVLFGWNSFFQNKIKNKAKRNLLTFMQSKT